MSVCRCKHNGTKPTLFAPPLPQLFVCGWCLTYQHPVPSPLSQDSLFSCIRPPRAPQVASCPVSILPTWTVAVVADVATHVSVSVLHAILFPQRGPGPGHPFWELPRSPQPQIPTQSACFRCRRWINSPEAHLPSLPSLGQNVYELHRPNQCPQPCKHVSRGPLHSSWAELPAAPRTCHSSSACGALLPGMPTVSSRLAQNICFDFPSPICWTLRIWRRSLCTCLIFRNILEIFIKIFKAYSIWEVSLGPTGLGSTLSLPVCVL